MQWFWGQGQVRSRRTLGIQRNKAPAPASCPPLTPEQVGRQAGSSDKAESQTSWQLSRETQNWSAACSDPPERHPRDPTEKHPHLSVSLKPPQSINSPSASTGFLPLPSAPPHWQPASSCSVGALLGARHWQMVLETGKQMKQVELSDGETGVIWTVTVTRARHG